MKSQSCIYLTILLSFIACSTKKNNPPECEQMICTLEFRTVQVKFKDALGNPVTVKYFSAINKRTSENTIQNYEPPTINNQGNYTVASDADVKKLSEAGDVITVSATYPATNKTTSAEFVISGGKCACHITKISGPLEISL